MSRGSLSVPTRLAVFTLALLVGFGCGDAPPSVVSAPATRDSAGIEIVENLRPRFSAGAAWRLTDDPILQVGELAGDDPAYLFGGITQSLPLDDGGWALVESTDLTIRYFDASGRYVTRAGGMGDGPDELRPPAWAEAVSDEVWVSFAGGLGAFAKVYSQDGDYLRTVAVEAPSPMYLTDGLSGRRSLWEMPPWEVDETDTPLLLESSLYLAGPTSEDGVRRVMSYPRSRIHPRPGRSAMTRRYAANSVFWAFGDRIFTGFPEAYQYEERDTTGAVLRIVRAAVPRRPVSEAERGDRDPSRVEEFHPAYLGALSGVDGTTWIRRHRGTPDHPILATAEGRFFEDTWDAFSPDGIWLTTLVTPERFLVSAWGTDWVAGTGLGPLDETYLRVYGIVKPGR